jgi:hypothetical protein
MERRIRFKLLVMLAMAVLLVIASAPYAKYFIETRRCGKRLAIIGQAARHWADVHNGRLPSGFIVISNELVTPRLLLCPGDKSREPVDNWQDFTSANTSYQIAEAVSSTADMPPEILQNICYLQCKVHGGNYANALGKVSVYKTPIPLRVFFLIGLTLATALVSPLWHRRKPIQGLPPHRTATADLLRPIERLRHNYLAARGMPPNPWSRRGLLATARHIVRTLAFFSDRESELSVGQNPAKHTKGARKKNLRSS